MDLKKQKNNPARLSIANLVIRQYLTDFIHYNNKALPKLQKKAESGLLTGYILNK